MRHDITKIATHERGATYKVSLRIPWKKGWIDKVNFHIWGWEDALIVKFVENKGGYAYFEDTLYLKKRAIYHYFFSFCTGGRTLYYKKENISGEDNITMEECFPLSVNFNVPDWAEGATAYQIFPDRYYRGKGTEMDPMPRRRIHENWDEQPIIEPDVGKIYNNDFFGGNLRGIIEKIPYLADLGIEVLYLNPIFRSQSTHRYDTGDYFQIDPYLGKLEDFKEMLQVAHAHGMKVILDGVYNHSGNDSIWYNEYGTFDSIGAYQSEESPYRDFYERDENGELKHWWGVPTMPVFNKHNPEFWDYMLGPNGVIRYWGEMGIDGWRFDVVDELPNDFVRGVYHIMQDINPDNHFEIGEIWENINRKEINHFDSAEELHAPMNYYLTDVLLGYYKYEDGWMLGKVLREILTEYPPATIHSAMNSTSTHDVSRYLEVLGCNVFKHHTEYNGKDNRVHNWDLDWDAIFESETNWSTLSKKEKEDLVNLHGSDEKLFENVKNEWQKNHKMTLQEYEHAKKKMKSYITALAFLPGMFTIFYGDEVGMQGIGNLLNRGTYPWDHEDKEVFEFYKKLIKSRKSEQFLRKADTRILEISQEHFVFERYDDNNKAIIITSRVDYETEMDIPEEYENAKVVFSTEGNSENTLAPYGAIVLKK